MFGMPIIEVAIGLVFVYMLLSMLCTFINEWIARLFSLRSKNLKEGLQQLLADKEMFKLVFSHPLIKGSAGTQKGPSYIGSENFARVLIDIIDNKSDGAAKIAKDSNEIKEALKKAQLPEDLKAVMIGLIDDGNTNITDLRKNLQTWFDNSMERVSGWYKRQLQLISFIVAFLLAFGLNADTITISQSLWKNPALRTEIANQAAIAIESCKDKKIEDCSYLNEAKVTEEVKKFPIGWSEKFDFSNSTEWSLLKIIGWVLLKIIGCLITALAISLGAPFWFDVLDKLNSIRSSGIKPKSATEK